MIFKSTASQESCKNKTLPEAQRTQGSDSITWIEIWAKKNLNYVVKRYKVVLLRRSKDGRKPLYNPQNISIQQMMSTHANNNNQTSKGPFSHPQLACWEAPKRIYTILV